MLMKIAAFIVGFLTFGVVVSLVQFLGGVIFSAPTTEQMSDPNSMKAFVAAMPLGAFIMLLLGYVLGSTASGFVMRLISKWDSLILPVIMGLIGMLGWIVTIRAIPHPMWVTVVGFLCFLPFTILGHRLASRT